MKKFISAGILCCILWLFAGMPVGAAASYVEDNAGLLTEDQQIRLEESAAELSKQWNMGFVILLEYGLGGEDPFYYAADYYDYGGYPADGVILLLDMEERDWVIVTSGRCISQISETAIAQIGSVMVPYFSNGQYAAGCDAFLAESAAWIAGERQEEDSYGEDFPLITPGYADTSSPLSHYLLGGGFVGAIVALVVCLAMTARMNTAKPQTAAGFYLVENSVQLTHSRDRFLYSNVQRTVKPQENSSSGKSGGSFRGSSGRSHGGGGGKF